MPERARLEPLALERYLIPFSQDVLCQQPIHAGLS
jgi:hypothetical protein